MLPTIDQLCKGYGANIKRVLEFCKQKRSLHRDAKNGYVLGKNPSKMRWLGEVPAEFMHPRHIFYKRYFHPGMDAQEKRKALYRFFRDYPAFSTVDKL